MPDMRFAPAPVLLAQKMSSGLNQVSVRNHNERLVLDLLRRERKLSRLEIGKRTGLSAQTVSVLIRSLRDEGIILEGEVHRGRVGPPTTPFTLNPDGAYAMGVYIGVKTIDACAIDLCGALRSQVRASQHAGDSDLTTIVELCQGLLRDSDMIDAERCIGLGVGLNKTHWPGHDDGSLSEFESMLAERMGLPCFILDDVSSAATGEVIFGQGVQNENFVYMHVGIRTSCRIVLNGQAQRTANDGLISPPSLSDLTEALERAGFEDEAMLHGAAPVEGSVSVVDDWIDLAAGETARSLISIFAFLDIGALVLASPVHPTILEKLERRISEELEAAGIDVPIVLGHNAQFAKASGAAGSVLSTKFALDWNNG